MLADQAHGLLDEGFVRLFDPPFAHGGRWTFPTSMGFAKQVTQDFPDPNLYPVDECGLLFTYAFLPHDRWAPGNSG